MPSEASSVRPTTTGSPAFRLRNSTTAILPSRRTATQSIRLSSARSQSPLTLKYSGKILVA